jgi:hypothetical protein
MPWNLRRLALVFPVAVLVGCGSPTLADGVTLETYVEAMAALRRIQDDPALLPAAKASARDSVLRAHGVTAKELESAAAVLASDPNRALATWQAIERRAKGTDSAAVTPPAAPAVPVPSPGGVPAQTPTSRPAVIPGGSPPR